MPEYGYVGMCVIEDEEVCFRGLDQITEAVQGTGKQLFEVQLRVWPQNLACSDIDVSQELDALFIVDENTAELL